ALTLNQMIGFVRPLFSFRVSQPLSFLLKNQPIIIKAMISEMMSILTTPNELYKSDNCSE
ncbi:TPA: hypothetical protein ACF3F7_003657, partial [Escherichia coli]